MCPMKNRETFFDLVKFFAMLMVVYGHVMGYRMGFDLKTMPSYAENFIVIVNMPLFFIISGYFSNRLHCSYMWCKLWKRLLKYYRPIIFFSFLFAVIECLLEHRYSIRYIPLEALKKILFCNWFFFALAGCDIITFIAVGIADRFGRKWALSFCLVAFLSCMSMAGRVWYTGNIVAMIPFYWFGLCLLPIIVRNNRVLGVTTLIGGGVCILFTFFLGNVAVNGLGFYWDRFDLWCPQFDKAMHMMMRIVFGVAGSLFVIGLVRMSLKVFPYLSALSFLGLETLGIYLIQGWLIRNFSNHFVDLNASVCLILTMTVFVYVVSFLIVKLLKLNKIVSIITGFA